MNRAKTSPQFFKKKPVIVGQYGATLHVRLKPQCSLRKNWRHSYHTRGSAFVPRLYSHGKYAFVVFSKHEVLQPKAI